MTYLAVIQQEIATVPYVVLCTLHVIVDITEGHLGLNHPELGQVPGSEGVLGTEGGAKSVDVGQSACIVFSLWCGRCAVHPSTS